MERITVSFPEQILLLMNMGSKEILASMKQEYAIKMYIESKLTLAQSAEFCDMDLYEFALLLSLKKIPVIDYSPDDLESELIQFSA